MQRKMDFSLKRFLLLLLVLTTAFFVRITFHLNRTKLSHYIKPAECHHPLTQIAFVKVHKTGSTTVTSLLQRFGLANNLTFALPKQTNWKISLQESINDNNVLPIGPGQEFDILCQHVLYNKTAFEKYLPKGVRLVTAVREPFQRFLSELLFFPQYRSTIHAVYNNISDTQTMVKVFLENPAKYQSRDLTAMNRMAVDLGIPESQLQNLTFVKKYIEQMDKDFDLVMLTEKLDDSLILLKRLMRWSIKDILYQWRYKGKERPQFGQDLIDRHKELALAEYLIYSHFALKFKRLLLAQNSDFWQESKLFKQRLKTTSNFCKPKDLNETIYFPASEFDSEFYFTKSDCKFMKLSETKFTAYLKKVQIERKRLSLKIFTDGY